MVDIHSNFRSGVSWFRFDIIYTQQEQRYENSVNLENGLDFQGQINDSHISIGVVKGLTNMPRLFILRSVGQLSTS